MEMNCIIDGHHGIYVPQVFATNFDVTMWGFAEDDEDIKILRNGPDDPEYWDAWNIVCDNANLIDPDGVRWTLYQDSDLFAVPDGYDWDSH